MKVCTKCGVEKHESDFAGRGIFGGFQAWCRVCKNAHARGKKRVRKKEKSVADIVWERHQREAVKQDKYEALKPK